MKKKIGQNQTRPRAQGLRFTSPPFSRTLSLALPSLPAATGRAAAPFVTSSPSPLPATSIFQVCPSLLFPFALQDGAPQTLTKLFVFGSESSYNILPTKLRFRLQKLSVCWVRPWYRGWPLVLLVKTVFWSNAFVESLPCILILTWQPTCY